MNSALYNTYHYQILMNVRIIMENVTNTVSTQMAHTTVIVILVTMLSLITDHVLVSLFNYFSIKVHILQ